PFNRTTAPVASVPPPLPSVKVSPPRPPQHIPFQSSSSPVSPSGVHQPPPPPPTSQTATSATMPTFTPPVTRPPPRALPVRVEQSKPPPRRLQPHVPFMAQF